MKSSAASPPSYLADPPVKVVPRLARREPCMTRPCETSALRSEALADPRVAVAVSARTEAPSGAPVSLRVAMSSHCSRSVAPDAAPAARSFGRLTPILVSLHSVTHR